jgi:hypothetical protein
MFVALRSVNPSLYYVAIRETVANEACTLVCYDLGYKKAMQKRQVENMATRTRTASMGMIN